MSRYRSQMSRNRVIGSTWYMLRIVRMEPLDKGWHLGSLVRCVKERRQMPWVQASSVLCEVIGEPIKRLA